MKTILLSDIHHIVRIHPNRNTEALARAIVFTMYMEGYTVAEDGIRKLIQSHYICQEYRAVTWAQKWARSMITWKEYCFMFDLWIEVAIEPNFKTWEST